VRNTGVLMPSIVLGRPDDVDSRPTGTTRPAEREHPPQTETHVLSQHRTAGWCRSKVSRESAQDALEPAVSEIRGDDLVGAACEFGSVVGPLSLAPVAVAGGLRGQQVEEGVAVAGIGGRDLTGEWCSWNPALARSIGMSSES